MCFLELPITAYLGFTSLLAHKLLFLLLFIKEFNQCYRNQKVACVCLRCFILQPPDKRYIQIRAVTSPSVTQAGKLGL